MAPWDLINSWGGVQSARTFKNIKNLSKSSFDHEILHLPPKMHLEQDYKFHFLPFFVGEGGSKLAIAKRKRSPPP